MLSFIMTPVYKNRSREADNPAAKTAYEEGEKYKIIDPEKALIWYIQAANQGHGKAAFEAEKIRKKLNMQGSINPEAHNRNLEETNKPIEKPKFTRPLSLQDNDTPQQTARLHNINSARPAVIHKPAPPAPKQKEQVSTDMTEVKKKAKAGDAEAQYQLANRYLKMTYKWLEKSADQKHEKANQQLIKLTTTPTEKQTAPQPVLYTTVSDYPHAAEEPLLLEYIYSVSEIPAQLPSQTVDRQPDYPVVPPLSGTYTADTRYSLCDIFQIILSYIRQKLGRAKAKPTTIEELKYIQTATCPTGRAKEQFAEQNLQSTIYNLQCRRMQACACDKRSRNHTYCRPRLNARPATA